jgi:hypothetical protein
MSNAELVEAWLTLAVTFSLLKGNSITSNPIIYRKVRKPLKFL